MSIVTLSAGDVDILMVKGDITLGADGATQLADRVRRLLERERRRILLDLSGVRYVDSVGLGELVQACVAARNRGGSMKLVGLGRSLNSLLLVTKLVTVFECFDSEAEAIASFPPPAAVH